MAFTRVLHRSKDDGLEVEVPTVRVKPLDPACDVQCGFVVKDRPYAMRQFLDEPSNVLASHIFLAETDYVFLRPLALPASEAELPMGFPFGYILPNWPTITHIMRRHFPEEHGDLKRLSWGSHGEGSGPAPVLISAADLKLITPEWERITAAIEADDEARETLGWVREMYAYTIAATIVDRPHKLAPAAQSKLMVQPPADHKTFSAAIAHYTWGSELYAGGKKDAGGSKVWEFDKRRFSGAGPTGQLPLPPTEIPSGGMFLQDGVAVTPDLLTTLMLLIKAINEGLPKP